MITKTDGRQDTLVAIVPFTFADFAAAGTLMDAVELPQGAIVVGGGVVIDVAFDDTTSDTLIVGDSADDNRYASAVDAQAEAYTALVPTAFEMLTQGNVTIGVTSVTGDTAAGSGRLIVQYVVNGRAHTSQG